MSGLKGNRSLQKIIKRLKATKKPKNRDDEIMKMLAKNHIPQDEIDRRMNDLHILKEKNFKPALSKKRKEMERKEIEKDQLKPRKIPYYRVRMTQLKPLTINPKHHQVAFQMEELTIIP